LIEAFANVKSADGYIMRIFVIAFTRPQKNSQVKVTTYAQNSQVREIRKKIVDFLTREAAKLNINELTRFLIVDQFSNKITQECRFIFPLRDVTIRKVKVLKRPKVDAVKLNEMYSHEKRHTGAIKADEDESAANTLTAGTAKPKKTEKPAK